MATGGVWDSFVLLPRILGCRQSFFVLDFYTPPGREPHPPREVFPRIRMRYVCMCMRRIVINAQYPNGPNPELSIILVDFFFISLSLSTPPAMPPTPMPNPTFAVSRFVVRRSQFHGHFSFLTACLFAPKWSNCSLAIARPLLSPLHCGSIYPRG